MQRKRFKDGVMQKLYEHHLAKPPKARGGSPQNAYFDGLDGKPSGVWPRGSQAYAAWAAGAETARLRAKASKI